LLKPRVKEFATAIYRGTQVLLLAAALATAGTQRAFAQTSLLNVSYDPTRELYAEINPLFAADWKRKSGQDIAVSMSHGGSGAQARAVIAGLDAFGCHPCTGCRHRCDRQANRENSRRLAKAPAG
jgi:sulfate transport system substrate-binding protein